jgi:hypothetical protein
MEKDADYSHRSSDQAIADFMLEHGFWRSEDLPGSYFNLDKNSSTRPDAPKGFGQINRKVSV